MRFFFYLDVTYLLQFEMSQLIVFYGQIRFEFHLCSRSKNEISMQRFSNIIGKPLRIILRMKNKLFFEIFDKNDAVGSYLNILF